MPNNYVRNEKFCAMSRGMRSAFSIVIQDDAAWIIHSDHPDWRWQLLWCTGADEGWYLDDQKGETNRVCDLSYDVEEALGFAFQFLRGTTKVG